MQHGGLNSKLEQRFLSRDKRPKPSPAENQTPKQKARVLSGDVDSLSEDELTQAFTKETVLKKLKPALMQNLMNELFV